jgi:hypothetical protein
MVLKKPGPDPSGRLLRKRILVEEREDGRGSFKQTLKKMKKPWGIAERT